MFRFFAVFAVFAVIFSANAFGMNFEDQILKGQVSAVERVIQPNFDECMKTFEFKNSMGSCRELKDPNVQENVLEVVVSAPEIRKELIIDAEKTVTATFFVGKNGYSFLIQTSNYMDVTEDEIKTYIKRIMTELAPGEIKLTTFRFIKN